MAMRQLKQQVLAALQNRPFAEGMAVIAAIPARQVINPLFSLLYHDQEIIRWRTVSAFGEVVARLVEHEPEAARVIMRRLMWNLNDESGGIGWGSPEAMGDIMARNGQMASEYAAILVSYLNPEGNYLEHPGLQQGVLWAIGRLARVQSRWVQHAAPFLPAFFTATTAQLRGLAVWAAVSILDDRLQSLLEALRNDPGQFLVYGHGRLMQQTVVQTVCSALG
jgi:hypothetical protein